MAITKARELLNALNNGKIDTATTLLESIDAIHKPELKELAALFDQTKSPGLKTLFKLTMKRRAVGKPSEGKLPNLKACENGAKVSLELNKLIAAGHKKNVMQAVGNTIKNWKSEDKIDVVPSQHTLKRDYNYYLEVKRLNPKFIMTNYPPLKNSSP